MTAQKEKIIFEDVENITRDHQEQRLSEKQQDNEKAGSRWLDKFRLFGDLVMDKLDEEYPENSPVQKFNSRISLTIQQNSKKGVQKAKIEGQGQEDKIIFKKEKDKIENSQVKGGRQKSKIAKLINFFFAQQQYL